jgi:putative (di)nucleoside polyphosphate hydrolase
MELAINPSAVLERLVHSVTPRNDMLVSCGTLVLNAKGDVLLCHVTGHDLWDLPKGVQETNEPAVQAAQRELYEETGLHFDKKMFAELGRFYFKPEKGLHLFKVHAPESFNDLGKLICTSYFTHPVTGQALPEMDGFRWATREEVKKLCGPNMQRVLLSIQW